MSSVVLVVFRPFSGDLVVGSCDDRGKRSSNTDPDLNLRLKAIFF